METETGFLNVQFLRGASSFEKTNLQEHELCVIGHDLNWAQITAVLRGCADLRMPEYNSGLCGHRLFDSGKTSLLNQLLSRRLESGHSPAASSLNRESRHWNRI